MKNTLNYSNNNYKSNGIYESNLDRFIMNSKNDIVVTTHTNNIIGKLEDLAIQISKPEFLKMVGPLQRNKISSLVNEAKYDARRLRNSSYAR
jgi:hypothetical protein